MYPIRLPGGPGYALTPRAERRLDDLAARIYRTRPSTWDGRWHVVALTAPPARQARERFASSLQLLGYGEVGPLTWVAPRPSTGLRDVLAGSGVRARIFCGAHEGDDVELATVAWHLDELGERYTTFVREWGVELSTVDADSPAEAFAASQRILHAWRKFLFSDPGLPEELVPPGWPGRVAAEFFTEQTARFASATTTFVDSCLAAERELRG